ncbi:MAG: polynucleotide adenylyltransferase PcnB [Gammaproteobacteria bacterium]|nr:MAG: polynucleotide adenylyltransferase PcnB [Gammaproteobacteria bacterium]
MNDSADTEREVPVIIPRPEHNISRANISKNALKVLYRLKDAGYESFIVGGGVRDLLLGREPKDFDIATDAHPEEVRRLFRNCRLIGRRFRLAHIHFGRDIIEVATFRAAPIDHDGDDHDHATSEEGRILRDNIYGGIDDDVWRRDFTANGLYYNVADFSIWDYVGGVEDVRNGVMRLIGDPPARYREDPVRMLRAVRFAAKLGFRIEASTEAPLFELGELLRDVPAARLFDECLKLFLSGHALPSFELLRHYDMFRHLFPAADSELEGLEGETFRALVLNSLENTDRRVAEGKTVTPTFLFAVFLWGSVSRLAGKLRESGDAPMQAMLEAADTVLRNQQSHVSIPRRFGVPLKDIMALQVRFRNQHGRRALRVLEHPSFRAAYDFMRLRSLAGEDSVENVEFWTQLQEMDPEHRRSKVQPARGRRRRRRRPPRRKKPNA